MPDTDVRYRTANRRTTTLAPDDIQRIALPGGVTVEVDMIGRTVTVDSDGNDSGGWTFRDQRRKKSKNT
jgi:hypothetical protein